MQTLIEITNLQSLLQLFTAVYLVAEWINTDRITEFYAKKHRDTFRYRLKIVSNYSENMKELFDGYESNAWVPFSLDFLLKKVIFTRRVCLLFSVISFIGLVISAMYSTFQINAFVFIGVVLLLLIPLLVVIFNVLIPIGRLFKRTKAIVNGYLKPIEDEISRYKMEHPEPNINEIWNASRDDEDRGIRYFKRKREYYGNLKKHMTNKFNYSSKNKE